MSWMNTGFADADEVWKNVPQNGKGPRRVWIRPETTSRLFFLDNDPSCFWEHQFFHNGEWTNYAACRERNRYSDDDEAAECLICQSNNGARQPSYAKYVGLFTVIQMTPWYTKKGKVEMNFSREILAPSLGSKEKPGILKKLERIKSKHGRLRGMCFDVYRSGAKTEVCGDEWEVHSDLCVEPTNEAINALRDKLLPAYLERRNANLPSDKHVDMEKFLKWNPWEPFNFEEMIVHPKAAELKAMGWGPGGSRMKNSDGGSSGSSSGSSGSSGSSSADDDFGDDDIPY